MSGLNREQEKTEEFRLNQGQDSEPEGGEKSNDWDDIP